MSRTNNTDIIPTSNMSIEDYLKPRLSVFEVRFGQDHASTMKHLHLEPKERGGGKVNNTHPHARNIRQLPHVQRARATARGIRRT